MDNRSIPYRENPNVTGSTGSLGNVVLNWFNIPIDMRDLQSVKNTMYGGDYIFYAEVLKQMPSCFDGGCQDQRDRYRYSPDSSYQRGCIVGHIPVK